MNKILITVILSTQLTGSLKPIMIITLWRILQKGARSSVLRGNLWHQHPSMTWVSSILTESTYSLQPQPFLTNHPLWLIPISKPNNSLKQWLHKREFRHLHSSHKIRNRLVAWFSISKWWLSILQILIAILLVSRVLEMLALVSESVC